MRAPIPRVCAVPSLTIRGFRDSAETPRQASRMAYAELLGFVSSSRRILSSARGNRRLSATLRGVWPARDWLESGLPHGAFWAPETTAVYDPVIRNFNPAHLYLSLSATTSLASFAAPISLSAGLLPSSGTSLCVPLGSTSTTRPGPAARTARAISAWVTRVRRVMSWVLVVLDQIWALIPALLPSPPSPGCSARGRHGSWLVIPR